MKVFKFGGASLKHAGGIRNVASIIRSYHQSPLLVVVSAMGKSTNALEQILHLAYHGKNSAPEINALMDYHHAIIADLFPKDHAVYAAIQKNHHRS